MSSDRGPEVAGKLHVRNDALLRQNRTAHLAPAADDGRAGFYHNNARDRAFVFAVHETDGPGVQSEDGQCADGRANV